MAAKFNMVYFEVVFSATQLASPAVTLKDRSLKFFVYIRFMPLREVHNCIAFLRDQG